MKKNITLAAMFTLLLALGGCHFGTNQGSDNTADETSGNEFQERVFTMEDFLVKPQPVEKAQGNPLAATPADLQNLVSGLDIDIRNSTYLILQDIERERSYANSSGETADFAFSMMNIIYLMYTDPAVSNVMAKDYNNCLKSIGLERLKKGEGRGCAEHWGETWKTQVIDRLLASTSLQNSLYEWVKPELCRVVGKLDSDQQTRMKKAISHMIAYTANYNHQQEKTFYNHCVNSAYGEWLFNFTGKIVDMKPVAVDDHSENPYRHLETWVFRRVEEESMSASQINGWLKKVRSDTGL